MKHFPIYCTFFLLILTVHRISAQVIFSYPSHRAASVSSSTAIGFRYCQPLASAATAPEAFIVTGSASGIHPGKVRLALDRKTVIFTPDAAFASGETVQVKVKKLPYLSGGKTNPYELDFR